MGHEEESMARGPLLWTGTLAVCIESKAGGRRGAAPLVALGGSFLGQKGYKRRKGGDCLLI